MRDVHVAHETLADFGARFSGQTAQTTVEGAARDEIARLPRRKRLRSRLVLAPPDDVAEPGQEAGVFDRGQHAERGEHLLRAGRNRFGHRAGIGLRPFDEKRTVSPRGEETRGRTPGRTGADDDGVVVGVRERH